MKLKTSLAAVLFVCLFGFTLYAQEPAGPRVKRARTPEDYQIGTLKELAAKASSAGSLGNKEETMVVDPDISPSRVRAKYAGLTARIPEAKAELIRQWARRYAGAPETYTRYEVDVAFTENGSDYWLTFTQKTLTSFLNSDTWNKPVDLFLIKMGAIKLADKWVPVLLVESFQEEIKKRQDQVEYGYSTESPLKEAVRIFNEEKQCSVVLAPYPPLTEDEVIAAIVGGLITVNREEYGSLRKMRCRRSHSESDAEGFATCPCERRACAANLLTTG